MPSRPTATVEPVSCLACTSRATPPALVPKRVMLRLVNSSRNSRESRNGTKSIRSMARSR